MILRSRLIGCGAYLPSRIVTNQELAQRVDTSDEWIVQRSGIRQRHVAAEDEMTSDLAIAAGKAALAAAGVAGAEVDMVLLATTTPDRTFPATATRVQAALGTGGFAFDLQAVCSGFIYALATADAFLASGRARTALVIGAETFTRLLDWQDRGTCVLFGDGAGAVVLRAEPSAGAVSDRGVLATKLQSDGRLESLLFVDGGPSSTQTTGKVRMEGREVFRHAVANLSAVTEDLLKGLNLSAADVDWLIPHQANRRIIDGLARRFGGGADRVVVTVDRHANTSAASVPLALAEAVSDGRIKEGDLALMLGVGGGMTWGGALVRM